MSEITMNSIAIAEKELGISRADQTENGDGVKIAYQWLMAQKKIATQNNHQQIKSLIRSWSGCFITDDDIAIAGHLLGVGSAIQNLSISTKYTLPKQERLDSISSKHKHPGYLDDFDKKYYSSVEL